MYDVLMLSASLKKPRFIFGYIHKILNIYLLTK